MSFNRPPRIQKYYPAEKNFIRHPENLPTKPTINWFMVGLPILGIGAVVGLSIWLSSGGMGFGLSYLIILPFTLASVLASVLTYRSQNKEYQARVQEIRSSYQVYLREKRSELQDIADRHLENLFYENPPTEVCLSMVEEGNIRLGERRPGDRDFLQTSIGIGYIPSNIEIDHPTADNPEKELTDLIDLAENLGKEFSFYNGAPVTLDLQRLGCVGIAGNPNDSRLLSHALVTKICTLHWVDEVKVGVFLGLGEQADWTYIDQLPHRYLTQKTSVNQIKLSEPENDDVLAGLEEEIRRRRDLLGERNSLGYERETAILPVLVLFFDNLPSDFSHSAISNILKASPELGVYAIFISDKVADIPSECKSLIEIKHKHISLQETGSEKVSYDDIVPDILSETDTKTTFSANLSKIDWLLETDLTVPPQHTSLLELFGIQDINQLPIEDWWDGKYPKQLGYMKALLGKFSPTDKFILDLNDADENADAHGPHGFIGGATGSGKSELLRTLIISLAITHHPYDLNFALIDYKGGAAFEELDQLPHVAGVITNIDENPGLAPRVIESLIGEMKTREKMLKDAYKTVGIRRAHIKDYRDIPIKQPLPRLVVIFDEFAEFKDRHPDEADKLISIARKGRTLGIHLILATQNPVFAVTHQVKDNAKFRISLSVNSPDASRDIIDIPDAYNLPPGRGYFKVSHAQMFQTAFTGKRTNDDTSEAQQIINLIQSHCKKIDLPIPPAVWPEPFNSQENLYLEDVILDNGLIPAWTGTTWQSDQSQDIPNFLGYYDYPAKQIQPIFSFGRGGGHLLIVGSPSSGKSTSLLTATCSLAYLNTPDEIEIYGIDCGSQKQLDVIRDFPHVAEDGGIVFLEEGERVRGLFSLFRRKISRKAAKKTYLLIDSYNLNIDDQISDFSEQILFILEHGPAVGIHVLITANLVQDIHYKIREMIMNIIALRQSNDDQYDSVLDKRVPKHLLYTQVGEVKEPGWALINNDPVMEMQIAFPTHSGNLEDIRDIGHRMLANWDRERPDDIVVLPDQVLIEDLFKRYFRYADSDGGLSSLIDFPIGVRVAGEKAIAALVDKRGLEPILLSISEGTPIFVIASTEAKKGKTTCLLSWLYGLQTRYNNGLVLFDIIDFHNKQFGKIANETIVNKFISSENMFVNYIANLKNEVDDKKNRFQSAYQSAPESYSESELLKQSGFRVIIIDDYLTFKKTLEDQLLIDELANILEAGARVGYRLWIADKLSMLTEQYGDAIVDRAKGYGEGILLGGSHGMSFFNDAQLPYTAQTEISHKGRGYLIRQDGEISMIQTAIFDRDKTLSDK